MSGGTGQGISDGTVDHLPPGWKKGLAGVQCVQSLEEAAVLMEELRGLPEFLFGYVAPGVKPKVIVFLDAEGYDSKSPKGMVPMLIPEGRLGSKEGLTGVTSGQSSVKRLLDREGARR
ncbi:MAG: hypothetical protein ACREVJ_08105 [Gammaproteobacteria bacterium]